MSRCNEQLIRVNAVSIDISSAALLLFRPTDIAEILRPAAECSEFAFPDSCAGAWTMSLSVSAMTLIHAPSHIVIRSFER
jgi:hypothetical protein